jgi:hypothetical protein
MQPIKPESADELRKSDLAPGPDGLVGDDHPAFGHQLLDLPQTQGEPVVQPHAVANDLHRVAVTPIQRR